AYLPDSRNKPLSFTLKFEVKCREPALATLRFAAFLLPEFLHIKARFRFTTNFLEVKHGNTATQANLFSAKLPEESEIGPPARRHERDRATRRRLRDRSRKRDTHRRARKQRATGDRDRKGPGDGSPFARAVSSAQ